MPLTRDAAERSPPRARCGLRAGQLQVEDRASKASLRRPRPSVTSPAGSRRAVRRCSASRYRPRGARMASATGLPTAASPPRCARERAGCGTTRPAMVRSPRSARHPRPSRVGRIPPTWWAAAVCRSTCGSIVTTSSQTVTSPCCPAIATGTPPIVEDLACGCVRQPEVDARHVRQTGPTAARMARGVGLRRNVSDRDHHVTALAQRGTTARRWPSRRRSAGARCTCRASRSGVAVTQSRMPNRSRAG